MNQKKKNYNQKVIEFQKVGNAFNLYTQIIKYDCEFYYFQRVCRSY